MMERTVQQQENPLTRPGPEDNTTEMDQIDPKEREMRHRMDEIDPKKLFTANAQSVKQEGMPSSLFQFMTRYI